MALLQKAHLNREGRKERKQNHEESLRSSRLRGESVVVSGEPFVLK
jgi:hypothetical protein